MEDKRKKLEITKYCKKEFVDRLNNLYKKSLSEFVDFWVNIKELNENEIELQLYLYDKSTSFIYCNKENFNKEVLDREDIILERFNSWFNIAKSGIEATDNINEKFKKYNKMKVEEIDKEIKLMIEQSAKTYEVFGKFEEKFNYIFQRKFGAEYKIRIQSIKRNLWSYQVFVNCFKGKSEILNEYRETIRVGIYEPLDEIYKSLEKDFKIKYTLQ